MQRESNQLSLLVLADTFFGMIYLSFIDLLILRQPSERLPCV